MNAEHELEVDWWPIEQLIPYARNPRRLSETAVAKVAASIAEFGWRQPVVVDEQGVIVVGHTRLLAARQLGLARVPVHVAHGLTPAQVKAYRIADNRTASENDWDLDLLPLEIADLKLLDADLDLLGFDEAELKRFSAPPRGGGLTDVDEVPELSEQVITKPGDLWLLGEHRVLCGDSTLASDAKRLMAGERAVLMATDPPYLVDYDGGNHPQTWGRNGKPVSAEAKTKHWDAYTDHESAVEFYAAFLKVAKECALTERPVLYQWFGMMKVDIVLEAWRVKGLLPHQVIIWKKSRPVLARCDFMWDYEPCMYGWIAGERPASELRPPANAVTVWEIAQRAQSEGEGRVAHPTQKPVETVRRPIEWHSAYGDVIYEPFSGSGTAIVASEITGRRCHALEIAPSYGDGAIRRWQAFTGQEATLEGDGRKFAEIVAERLAKPT